MTRRITLIANVGIASARLPGVHPCSAPRGTLMSIEVMACTPVWTSSRKRKRGRVRFYSVRPAVGLDVRQRRRGTGRLAALATGPGNLCQAFAIDLALNGWDI